MTAPVGENVIDPEAAERCYGTGACPKPARHRCPTCARPLCNRHAKSSDGVRVCHKCRMAFPRQQPLLRSERVGPEACGAIHVDPVDRDRIHSCDRPSGHHPETQHGQMHRDRGACGVAYCAGMFWRSDLEPDSETVLWERIIARLDEIADALETWPTPAAPSLQISLFE